MNTVLVGLQWGDEGKGKVIDAIAGGYDVVVRFNGGPNAGHTVVFGGKRYALHHVPSGIFKGKKCLIAAGTIIDPEVLIEEELDLLDSAGFDTSLLEICGRSHIILPIHRTQDEVEEMLKGKTAVGTTKRGIGPCYMDRDARIGIRLFDLYSEELLKAKLRTLYKFKLAYFGSYCKPDKYPCLEETYEWLRKCAKRLAPHVVDGVPYLNDLAKKGRRILFEGAQGTMLDVNYGSYPYVTSSSCVAAGASTGSGVPMKFMSDVLGVAKAYVTRVGSGPFPTEMEGELAKRVQTKGKEFGTTTGRARRVGWLDLVALRTAVMMNGANSIALMKADVLSCVDEVKVCTHYRHDGKRLRYLPPDLSSVEPVYKTLPSWCAITDVRGFDKLPKELRNYISFVEKEIDAKVALLSYGPEREKTVTRKGFRP